mgnify:CR=1 FL=1
MKFIKQIIFIILSLLWGLCAVDLIAQPTSWTEVTDYEYVVTDLAFDDTGNLFVSKQNGTVFVNDWIDYSAGDIHPNGKGAMLWRVKN